MRTHAAVGAAGASGPSDSLRPLPSFYAHDAAARLLVWRQSLIGDLWRPGRRCAPTLRAELRRVERQICDIYWPRWREVA